MHKFVKCKSIDFTRFYSTIYLDLQPYEFSEGYFIINRNLCDYCVDLYTNEMHILGASSDLLNQWFFVSDFNPELMSSEIKAKLWNELGSLENPDIELIDTYNYILNG